MLVQICLGNIYCAVAEQQTIFYLFLHRWQCRTDTLSRGLRRNIFIKFSRSYELNQHNEMIIDEASHCLTLKKKILL